MRRTWTIPLSIMALIAMAGVASAANGEDDTLLNFGYDETNHVFIADVSGTDEPYDCTLEDGTLIVGYGEVGEDLIVAIDTLSEDGVLPIEFQPRPEEEVGEDFEPATDPAPYDGAEGPCGLFGTHFDGAINHGAFLSAFNAYLGTLDLEGGRGCLVRIIAKSDLGKGDQQINEADPEFEIGDTGEVAFTTESADCEHGKPDFDEDHPGQGQGKPDPESHPGKSENAGGRGNGR